MQLSKIKIAGFKSFVDPTTLVLPSHLVAVVGPNGCGKSNIIDAVTWVMGESSPKYLRGESLTDVIFNGSNARKPVGQASVELIFDNSDGTIKGEYGQYAEISVKRMLNRDSDSSYYLNGVRCRKKDIVDIFLGTGLGPRSYSIIGQNMIIRMIEAKPDELRTYLEEAAGISKYKERRHETELRIGHTKENLARVTDVCVELDKQLNHLKHQANVAEKYKLLKQQERLLKAQLYAIQWRTLDSSMVENTLQIQRQETALEARQTELTTVQRDAEQLRHEQRVTQDAFQEVQRRYYAVGNDITRIEQEIVHHQSRQQQWEHDLQQADHEWQTFTQEMSTAETQLVTLEQDIHALEPALATARQTADESQQQLAQSEEALQAWQMRWDEFNQLSAKTTQTAQVEKMRMQHLEQRMTSTQRRQEQLQQEQSRINFSEANQEIETLTQTISEVSHAVNEEAQHLAEVRNELGSLQVIQVDANAQLDKVRSELQRLRGQQASLEALQQTALGQRDNATLQWIHQHQYEHKPRLAQHIVVDAGWEFAAEKVLGFCLQAICVAQIQEVIPHLDDFSTGNLCVITDMPSDTPVRTHQGTLLLEKVRSPWPLTSLIAGIYVAESLDDALKLCESLADHESVITRDGIWLNRSWLKIFREEDPAAGIFQREQELKHLHARIEELQTQQTELEESIAQHREQCKSLEQQRDQYQQTHSQLQAKLAQVSAQQKLKRERLAELKSQSERITKQQEECAAQLVQTQSELTHAREVWQQATDQLTALTQQRESLVVARDQVRDQVQQSRTQSQQQHQAVHELEMRLQNALSQKAALHQALSRLQTQLKLLNERKIGLESELKTLPPLDTIKQSLNRTLEQHTHVAAELNTARQAVETLEQDQRHLEEKRQVIERESNKVRLALEHLRVECQGLKVKSETVLEQFKATEFVLADVLKELPEELVLAECQSKLEQVTTRIQRLGAINLVAIEEYATCLERKQYLDKQLEDLNAGLATLEEAIAKIDKETKVRFKETFDKVNARFQELFPAIFGGGKAYLELNDEDLLSAGVTMMACPPGKRNSSIYLLSGGEKSLTALALIFSIFHLNPAPFCLLDEVDAALDDANVVRFTKLVKMMSEKTQFIFVSHNKITIEMGQHLVGVTMNEPGVSRLVSVDIEKAMSLAGA